MKTITTIAATIAGLTITALSIGAPSATAQPGAIHTQTSAVRLATTTYPLSTVDYQRGFKEGYRAGFRSGYTDGRAACRKSGFARNQVTKQADYERGFAAGFGGGYNSGFALGCRTRH